MKLRPKTYRIIMQILLAAVLFAVLQLVTCWRNSGSNEHYEPTGNTHGGIDPTYYD